jgi:hypothetical protein
MTLPVEPPPPPAVVGTQPRNADEVNGLVGTHLRGFTASKAATHQDQEFFVATDLKAAPYYFSAEQETLIKSAVSGLDQALQAVDMTFISRIIGMA